MAWYSHLFQNFPQLIVIHTVKGFGIVNKAEVEAFLKLSSFFDDPTGCWKFDLWFPCLFKIQLECLKVHSSCTVEAWLGEF